MAKSTVARTVSRARKARTSRRRRATPARDNPRDNGLVSALTRDMATRAVPAVIGYTGARVAGRIAFKLGKRRSVTTARIAGGATPAVVALGMYAYAQRLSEPARTQAEAAALGAIVGAAQAAVQALFPTYAYVVSDYHFDDKIVPPGYVAVPIDQLPPAMRAAAVKQAPGTKIPDPAVAPPASSSDTFDDDNPLSDLEGGWAKGGF